MIACVHPDLDLGNNDRDYIFVNISRKFRLSNFQDKNVSIKVIKCSSVYKSLVLRKKKKC